MAEFALYAGGVLFESAVSAFFTVGLLTALIFHFPRVASILIKLGAIPSLADNYEVRKGEHDKQK
ncbi:MAG: hypothetical protein GY947_02895 [Rhodobacteraceae bacterium]|nr:hypothetical protein [Paracoccaceae bacterium]